jgi:hypothetical protein
VKTLRLHNTIYPADSIAQTMEIFDSYGSLRTSQDGPYTEVQIEAIEGVDESDVVGGFANYVLTLAVQSAGASRSEALL